MIVAGVAGDAVRGGVSILEVGAGEIGAEAVVADLTAAVFILHAGSIGDLA